MTSIDVVVVAAVGQQSVRPPTGPADPARDGWDLVEEGHQLGDVIAVAAGQRYRERDALAVDDEVVLAARPCSVDRAGPACGPLRAARPRCPRRSARRRGHAVVRPLLVRAAAVPAPPRRPALPHRRRIGARGARRPGRRDRMPEQRATRSASGARPEGQQVGPAAVTRGSVAVWSASTALKRTSGIVLAYCVVSHDGRGGRFPLQGQERVRDAHQAEDVGFIDVADLVGRQVLGCGHFAEDASVVDENVQVADPCAQRLDRRAGRRPCVRSRRPGLRSRPSGPPGRVGARSRDRGPCCRR